MTQKLVGLWLYQPYCFWRPWDVCSHQLLPCLSIVLIMSLPSGPPFPTQATQCNQTLWCNWWPPRDLYPPWRSDPPAPSVTHDPHCSPVHRCRAKCASQLPVASESCLVTDGLRQLAALPTAGTGLYGVWTHAHDPNHSCRHSESGWPILYTASIVVLWKYLQVSQPARVCIGQPNVHAEGA